VEDCRKEISNNFWLARRFQNIPKPAGFHLIFRLSGV